MINTAIWVVTALVAAAFLFSGALKLVSSRQKLMAKPGAGWAGDFPAWFIKVLGTAEVLGSLGLVLPAATGIAPVLTPIAASCLAALMVGAGAVMYRRGEYKHIIANAVYFALLVTIAVCRF
ncbi:DoxX family protein [Actinorhabdospora filicis]|uniref:DoxX family protein n=1 Tax=Actinorhabdospora filicis TaxID=1785913 RepID=UPI002557938A|nr:DoxX family protein [Actinorhabdospora filicis]